MNNPFFNKLRGMNRNELITYTENIIKDYQKNKDFSAGIALWYIHYYIECRSHFYTIVSQNKDFSLLSDKELLKLYTKFSEVNKFNKRLKKIILQNKLYNHQYISITVGNKVYSMTQRNFKKEKQIVKEKKVFLQSFVEIKNEMKRRHLF